MDTPRMGASREPASVLGSGLSCIGKPSSGHVPNPAHKLAFALFGLFFSTFSSAQTPSLRIVWPSDGEFARVNATIESACSHHPEIDIQLVWALIWQESKYDPLALGTKGEVGLGQLMPATAQALGVRDRTNIDESVDAVVGHLAHLYKKYKHNISLTLAAYNGGEAYVDRCKCVPPASRAYVSRIEENEQFAKKIVVYIKSSADPHDATRAKISKLQEQVQQVQQQRISTADQERVASLEADLDRLRTALRSAIAESDNLRQERETLRAQLIAQNNPGSAAAIVTTSLQMTLEDLQQKADSKKTKDTAPTTDVLALREQVSALRAEMDAKGLTEKTRQEKIDELSLRVQRLTELFAAKNDAPPLTQARTAGSGEPLVALVAGSRSSGMQIPDQALSAMLQDTCLRHRFRVTEELQTESFISRSLNDLIAGQGKPLKKLKPRPGSKWDYVIAVRSSGNSSRDVDFNTVRFTETAEVVLYDRHGDVLTSRSFSQTGAGFSDVESREATSSRLGKDIGDYVVSALRPTAQRSEKE